jgi:hypothetical protein
MTIIGSLAIFFAFCFGLFIVALVIISGSGKGY